MEDLTKEELILIKEALEFQLRILIGQFGEIYRLFEKYAGDNPYINEDFKKGNAPTNSKIRELLYQLRYNIFPKLEGSSSYLGVYYEKHHEVVLKLYNLHEKYTDIISKINELERNMEEIWEIHLKM